MGGSQKDFVVRLSKHRWEPGVLGAVLRLDDTLVRFGGGYGLPGFCHMFWKCVLLCVLQRLFEVSERIPT